MSTRLTMAEMQETVEALQEELNALKNKRGPKSDLMPLHMEPAKGGTSPEAQPTGEPAPTKHEKEHSGFTPHFGFGFTWPRQ